MTENQQLRGLLRDLGSWIGNGTGGPLASHLSGIGWQMPQFEAFLNHTETDTAFDVFATLKKSKGKNGAGSTSNGADASASPVTNDTTGERSSRKRRRTTDDFTGENLSSITADAVAMHSPSLSGGTLPEAGPSSNSFTTFMGGRSGNIPGSSVPSSTNPQGSQNQQQDSGQTHSLLGLAAVAESHLPMNLPIPPDPVGASYPGFSLPPHGYNPPQPIQPSAPGQYAGPLFGEEIGGVDDGGLLRKNEAGACPHELLESPVWLTLVLVVLTGRLFK